MSTRPLRKQLSWLLWGILLATTSTSHAQNNPCQQSQQRCLNGAICRQAYLNPGYICECQGEWQGQNCEQRLPTIPIECGSNFYTDSGVIVSTNYPLPPNDNEDCFYLVRIPSAESITFHFDVFLSENFKDGLIIYPGTTVNDQLPDLRTFIGSDLIAPQTFNTNQVVLYWYTDFNVPSGGFSIRYEADPDPCWVNPCQNGGLCNRIGGIGTGYQCNCLPDFRGVNCEIGTVIVAQTTISVSSGIPVIQGRLSQSFTFDLTFSPGQTQFLLTGTGLWSVTLFLRDNLGNQVATKNVNLNNQQSSVAWRPPSASTIFSLQSTLNTNALSCTQVASLCGVIGQGQSPSTPFSIRGVQGSTSLVGCTSVQCRGLEITQVDFGSSLRTLREGVNNQIIQFDFTAYSNPQAGQVSGTNLWKFTLFGSTQPNGLGNRVLTRALALNQGQLNAVPGLNGNILFLGLETTLSLNGLTCSQVQYICVTFSKGDNPSPDFTMSGTPSDTVLTVCQPTTCRGVQVSDTSVSVTSGNILLERQSNTVGFTLSIFTSSSGGSVSGQNLFNIKTFGSNTQTGTSSRISERDIPGNTGITAGVVAVIPNLSTMLDLNNLLCQQVVALCTELSKGINANPDFTLEPVPSTDVLRDCINMECRGVYIGLMTINPTVNRQLLYGNRNHMLTFNLRIQADSPSASISGSNLWQLLVFASNQLNGQGTRRGQAVVTLTQSQMSSALTEGGQINFINLQATMDLSSVTSCAEIIYLCVQLQKGQAPNPDFTLQGNTVQCLQVECTSYDPCVSNPCQNNGVCSNTGNSYTCSCSNGWTGVLCGTAVNACINHRCENGAVCINRQFSYDCQCTFGWTGNFCQLVDSGVILSHIQLFLANLALREGTANNNLNFNLILTSDASGQTITGTGLWSFNVYGSTQLDGSGQRYGVATAVYNSAQSTQLSAGGTLTINGVQVSLDLSQVVCSQVPYLCVEVVSGASASPAFRLSGDQVECAQINCQGVNIINTQLQVVSSSTVLERDSSNPLTLDMTITTSPTSAGVSGLRLWQVTTYLSTQPDGSGTQFGQSIIQLSDAQSGLNLIPGQAAIMSALSVSANTANLMCGQFGFICARLEKSPSSTVDFTLNSPSYVACAPVTCKGVEITDIVGTISSGMPVHSDLPNNVVQFDVTVSSNPNGASINGANLWEVLVFSDSQLDGQGTTVIQSIANLPGSSGSNFLQAGIDMVIRGAQVTLNLNGISCNQIPYICVQLRQALNPSPDFTFTPVPSDDVLVHCQRLTCNACRSQTCLNGAVCVDVDPGLFRCDCTPGWTGTYCGIVADYCLTTQPCLNGGQCVGQSSNTFQCTCPQEWVGLRCQTDNPCLPNNPCLNGGTCFTNQNGIYTCTCINGYIGQNCQIAPNPCVSTPCQNGGICERIGTGSNYECLCTFGFEGLFCETLLDPCISSPCLNGGNCSGIDMTYVYQCQCTEEYEGINCQSRKNPCANNPCLNGGVCNPIGSTNYQCSCNVGYTGTNCGSLLMNPCDNNPCLNNGQCIWSGTTIVYRCQCTTGFSGENCQIFNLCQNLPCQNGGVCSQAGSSFTCQCAPGYTGNTCSQVISFCLVNSNPCQNGGTCLSIGTSYQCQCLTSYTGNTCATLIINLCQNLPCQNGGACSQAGSSFTCQCAPGYTGNTCSQVVNFCLVNNNPCQNGGTCVSIGTSYQCQCLTSYTGNTCATLIINLCQNVPCQNGGVCSQAGSSFTCQCAPGYTGNTCSQVINFCLVNSNPCQNGGTCVSIGTSYQCQCLTSYTGNTCATLIINLCQNVPCQNGGVCSQAGSSFTCQCAPGYTGNTCSQVINFCLVNSNPCQNGGTCVSIGTSYQCQCLTSYTGNTCATLIINLCQNVPCQNGGVCSQAGSSFTCQCAPGYTGNTCSQVINFCLVNNNPCQNGGTCLSIGTSYQCQCHASYTGNTCAFLIINLCQNMPCQNGGVCSQAGSSFTCQCAPGYTGNTCSQVINFCLVNSNPCQNGGTCVSIGTSYQCQCLASYTGNTCATLIINFCTTNNNPCQNGGTCLPVGTGYQCQCLASYTGNTCTIAVVINPCLNNPCLNGGACQSGLGSTYTCQCMFGFSGLNCQNQITGCASNPCVNGGQCIQVGTGYRCQCLAGYTGTRCNVFINPCSSNPCQNNGNCNWLNPTFAYQCQCQPSYTGINCELPLDGCLSSPCFNGATCRSLGTNFQCQCAPGYTGNLCTQTINPCGSNPCLNGGVCSWLSPNFIYRCQCSAGYTGVNCASVINPCVSSPCLNGATCRLLGTNFQCQCAPGYTGSRCSQVLNPCSTFPCLNNGFCQWSGVPTVYSCQCTLGFVGLRCQTPLDPCDSNPCQNNGFCNWQSPNYAYQCQCPPAFTGTLCQTPIGPCFSNPCVNGGQCFTSNSGAGYFCNCLGNFKGDNCQYPEPCSSNPCSNNGDCNSPVTGSSYSCTCLNNFQGLNCQYPNPCSSQPCQNGGLCIPNSFGTSFQCNCPSNYLGVICEIGNPCISNPCLNGGACRTDTTGSRYFCNCVNNFIGFQCQFTNPCLPNPCQNGAVCSQANSGQTYTCSCINGFFGVNCQTPDPCRSFPCSNGGNCIITNGGFGYNCNCPQQYMGATCQYPNPCSSNPCLNGGFCESHPLGISYTCSCQANFQGVNCQFRNPCASNPCINGGVCQLGVDGNSFVCNCPQQFMGLRCENLNPCLQQRCLNGGTCTPLSQGLEYRCTCLPSYFGITCENRDPCSSSPCLNGGVCNPTASGYFCACPAGFNGINCNNMNPCGGNPCQNGGSCFESAAPNGFFCRCTSAYIGPTCTIPDLCSYEPCQNGGTCTNNPTGTDYSCECPLGYVGVRCEEFNPCISNPCRNGGTCNRDSQGTIYSCICVPGYTGRDCESGPNCFSVSDFRCGNGECITISRKCDGSFDCLDGSDENNCQVTCTALEFTCAPGVCISRDLICNGINNCNNELDEQNCPSPCDSGPCLNGGTCRNIGASFICTCTFGWMGETCAIQTTGSNDPPRFVESSITINIPESTSAGSNVFHLDAVDADSSSLTFNLHDNVAQQLFIVVPDGPNGAYLTLKQQLDREEQHIYNFLVSVTDGFNEVQHSGTLLVSDVNDNAPMFINLPNTTTVHENVNFGFNVFNVLAVDPDALLAKIIQFSISEETPGPFSIHSVLGNITVSGTLDYETNEVYNIKIIARDSGTNSLSTESYLTINVIDVQDAGPEFLNTPYDKAIDEGTPVNTVVQQVVAVDKDTLNPNSITYSIISGNQGSFFELNSNTGEITVVRELDREDPNLPQSVEFNIRAMEIGPGGGQSAFTTFNIVINDLNDEPPMFDQSVYAVSVSEAELPGFILPVNIHVTDGEAMIQGNFRITLQNGNTVPFSVSPSSAVDQASVTLTLIRPLDYETTKVYNLQLFAEDSATSSATVVVTVTDANDNNPLFTNQIQPITLREGAFQNTPVTTLTTTDADEGINADTRYRIIGGNQGNLFTINPSTGVITTTTNVDYENSAQTYTLTIEAYNTAPAVPPATGVSVATLVISIEDINDNPPIFQPSFYNRTIYENSDTGPTIIRVHASDADAGPAGDIRFSIIGGNVDGSFSINAQTGDVILLNPLDRETLDFYDIIIRAEDNVVPSQTATAHLTVHVGDSNDNSPQWNPLQYSQSLLEGLPANTFVTQVSATDIDLGMNAKLQYYLATPSQNFWINQTTGRIYTSMPLDREQIESITLNVMVRDLGNPQRNSAQPAMVMVTVLDVNDTPPTFTGIPYNFEVAENGQFGTFVGQATAEDPDTIGNLVYSILSQTSNFFIDPTTGRIATINSLDREQLSSYQFEVQVTDGLHTATEMVTVTVTDENDNDPVFTEGNLYELTVEENMLAGLILRLQATDADEGLNKKIVYQFDPTSNPPYGFFYLDQESGELRTTGPLDREIQDMYTLIVVAKDRNGEPGGRSTIATVLVTVTDVNDNKPYFDLQSYSQFVPEDIVLGGYITKVEAIDRDIGENAVILYRIIQGNEENHFSIDANGTITRGPVPLDRETKVFYQLTVEAYNAGDLQPRNTATVTITVTDVNDEVPVFTQDVYLRPDLMENVVSGAQVATVLANDPDEGSGGQVLYSLTGGDTSFFFIDTQNGIITVQGSLPGFDVQSTYNLTVTATDQAQPFHSSTSTVMVHLVDAQDDPPEFTTDKYEVHLNENTGQGFMFLQVAAAITGKPNSEVTYSLGPNVNPNILELFELDAATGMLTTKKPIDYEAGQNLYTFTILGESDGVLPGSSAVWVYIDDVNDNNPVFVNPQTDVTVTENNPPGFIFTTVTATDADSGQNGELIYYITGGNEMGHFDIVNDLTGATHIATSTSLDRETIENYILTITAVDKGEPTRNSSIDINVHVGDLNDNAPMYNQTINTASVVENILLNRPIGTIVFADYDLPSSNNIEFYIDDASNPNGIFQINSLGQITMTGPLDREMQAFYDLLVVMRDQTYNAGFSETTHFYINITDQNDNQPIFPPQPPVIVTEGPSSTGNIFVTVTADDNDFGQNSNVIYTITGGNADGIFGIHQNNGSIYVIKELDWETTKNYELIVTATDQAGNVNDRRTGTVTVTVNVEDINDTPPVFPLDYYGPYNFFEGVSGTYIGTFVASDSDSGLGGEIKYTLIGNLSNLFFIHPDTGVLTLKPTAVLDYEYISNFNLTIIATDAGTPSFSGNTTVGINVLNINDHTPQFMGTPYRVSINDTEAIGSLIYNVLATDADSGPDGNITYSIFDGNTGEMFWINPLSGDVYVNKTLTNGVYVLIVKAKDNPLNPLNSKEATGTLTILVTDSTSTIPVFTNNGLFNANVFEHSPEGTYVTTVAVMNPADVGQLTYSISGPDAAPFFINPVTGRITVNGVLDIEVKDRHIFEVTAIGSTGVSTMGSVNVNILNINDYSPVIGQTFNFSVPEDATNDHFVGVVTATDQDYGVTTFHFSILSGGGDKFAINPDTGTITVSVICRGDVCDETPLDREIQDLYTLNVQVSDLGSPLLSAQEVVYIYVTDVNDFRPYFDYTNIVVSVEENSMLNKPITTVHAIDQDLSASLIYIIESVTATDMFGNTPTIDVSQWFSVNSTTGVVYVSGHLDRENASEVVLTISGKDEASTNADTSTTQPDATVTISITDINEHGPVFQPDGTTVINTSVQEESAVGTIIINVEAIDPDNPINGMVIYTLTGNSSQYAYIDSVTGQITVNKNIDRELLNWLNFTVVATDSGNPSLSTSIPITVQVLDVNDNNPVFNQSEYVTTVTENTGSGTFVIVTPATDKDKGQYGTVTYKLTGGNGFFTIDANTGEITTLQSLDQESQEVYTLTVTATDNEGGSDSRQNTTTVIVYVGDVNEHAPTVNPNYVFEVDENLPNRTLVGVIDATDADNPMETFNFTFTFANPSDGNTVFYIDKNTGEIFTNQQIDSDSSSFAKNYTFTILVSDNGNPSKTTETTTTINIKDLNDNNPVFVNAPYNITISELFTGNVMTVMGQDIDKNSVLTYKIVNGNINDTFFINPSTGVITVSNRLDFESIKKYNLTILVEDQDGLSSSSHVVINIKDANDQTPVFVGPQPYQFNVFENVALGTDVGVILATDADSDPTNSQLTYHITNSVPFTINEMTGLIETSGMLDRETQDQYLLDVQVRNQGHTVATQVLINILDVNDNTPNFEGEDNITRSFPENSQGNFPIYQPSATDADIGENGRITYSIVSGNVENIFSINSRTGAIVLSRPITSLTDLVHNFKLIIEARDNGTNKLYSNITLNMLVGDYNDNGPVFIYPNVTVLTLPENKPIGHIISSVLATDRDTGTNGMVTYGFLNEDGTYFSLQSDGAGAILLSNFIADREKQDQYTLVLLASDGSDTNKRVTPLELTILITDENDNEPFFIRLDENTALVQILNITEHSSSGTSTGHVNLASDLDLAPFNNIYYYIVGGNGNGTFRIDKNTGEIFVVGDLDRETTGFHNLIIKATNNATYVASGIYDVTKDTTLKEVQIEVKDINDNGPAFDQKIYVSSILTNAEEQTQISCIRATDVDLGDTVDYTINSVSYTLDGQTTIFDDTFYIEKGTGCIRSNKLLTGVGAGGFFDISVVATDSSGNLDNANVRVFTLDDKQKVVLIVDGSREDVIKQQLELIEVLKTITGGEVVIDDVTTYINENGVTVPGQTMVTFHVIDQNTNSAIAAAEILRLIDINRATINTLFQKYAVVEAFALGGGAGGAVFGVLEAALLAIALLLFLGALIFIIILCCLQRRFLKKIHGNSAAVIYATRADADVKEAAAYQGSNPLWLESADSYPDDWPDSISLIGGGVNREYESQEASMDFFSDMQTEVARDALVMTALINDGSVHGQAGTGRVKTLSNGAVASNGRITSNGRLAGSRVAASNGGFGSGAGRSGAGMSNTGRSSTGMSSTTTTQMSSSGARLVDGMDGSAGTLTNRLNRDGSVTANLNSGIQDGGYSGSGASYTYSSVGFGGSGPSAGGSQRLTNEKAHEIRQMLDEDETVEATFLDGTMYGNGDNSAGMAAARAVYREDVEFENQLSPITEEDTTSSWSSWTRDSDRSGGRHPGGTLERNRTAGRSSKDYQDPMNNYTTSTSVEENYTHSVKKPSQTESSSYSRRANSKTYSAGVPTSIGMVTLTEETPEMIGFDVDEDSEAESSVVDGRTYTYNVMGDNTSEGARSLSGASSGHSSAKRKETNIITQEDDDDDDDEAGEIIEETETRRSKKTTRAYTNSGYNDYMDEESRL